MNDQPNNSLINIAKEKFMKFAKNNPEKMTLTEFKNFLDDFLKMIRRF